MKLSHLDVQKEQKVQFNKKYGFFIKHEDTYVQIVAELPNVFTVEDAIKYTLSQFNQELGTNFQFGNGIDYILKISKKSGEPKADYPSLDYEQVLAETGCQLFTLIGVPNPKKLVQQSNATTTTDASIQEASIKSRTSYTNGLSKKPIDNKKQGQGNQGGFCFFNQCI